MFYKDEKLALFIDGSNFFATARELGFQINYKALKQEFLRRGKLLRVSYYTSVLETDDHNPIKPLLDYLNYNGFHIITKPAKEYFDHSGNRKVKGNTDIELSVDVLELASAVDHVVIFSGNGDYVPLIDSIQRKGIRVSVVSSIKTQPPMISDDLRKQADNFIELEELREIISLPQNNN